MKQRAMAIAIATVLVAAGLSLAPPAAAQPTNCAATYAISDSQAAAVPRPLLPGMEEVGAEEVLAGNSERLNVEFVSGGSVLEWNVFHLTEDGDCVRYKSASCAGELDQAGETDSCVLEDPDAGAKTYYLNVENIGSEELFYRAWTSI